MEPRAVIVTRPSEYEGLLARHATFGQAKWVLEQQGQDIGVAVARHRRQQAAVATVARAAPDTWRQVRVTRADLDRFLFEPEDIVLAVGQDGLVPNVAKYLDGQPVLGVNPEPEQFEGVLVRHPPEAVADLLRSLDRLHPEHRTMVEARVAGQRLLALNEVFVGHRTHQSARYTLGAGDAQERQSSSGLIVATGTGATGWARSVHRCHRSTLELPGPTDPRCVFFVREAWPSTATGADLTEGAVTREGPVRVVSEMTDGGVLFGDGIEQDAVPFDWASEAVIGPAQRALVLV